MALFFTGRRHAGENLSTVLARRAADLAPPIQMCHLGPAARETS
jgi:transposase